MQQSRENPTESDSDESAMPLAEGGLKYVATCESRTACYLYMFFQTISTV